ncbi:hypothetical protein C8Q75DRAFT_732158 [Abortiporus biennis]|nr:hypothetical protein C8Q75DRAFT_732158 [Abortiporus biennis]
MPFYPDNQKRARRLEQLVNSIAGLQSDIQDQADRIDKRSKDIRRVVGKLLTEHGIDNIDLIAAAKKNSNLNWEELIVGLLIGPAGAKLLDANTVLALGRSAVRASGVRAIGEFFRTVQEGSAVGINIAAEKLVQAATESEKALNAEAAVVGVGATGEPAATAAKEVSKAAKVASKVAVCIKLLGTIGFIVTVIMTALEVVHGSKQKTELIKAIHNAQPARLCIAYFAAEAKNISEQLVTLATYVDLVAQKDKDSEMLAKKLRDTIIQRITTDNSLISWKTLEKKLLLEDKKSASYYGDNDLDSADVVRLAKTAEKESQVRPDDD